MERFVRIEKLLGKGRAAWLRRRSVTIVGIGAVGGYALEGLARAGISHIRLVDFDMVAPSNINRQILALDSTVGMLKVEAARQRVLDINPRCRVEALPLFADATNIAEILTPPPDIVIDAIDSVPSKIELLAAAYRRDIAVVSSMGAALRTDPGQIKVNDLFNTKKCPLARRLRKQLRQAGVGPGITCVYSTEDIDFTYGEPIGAADTDEQLRQGRRPRRLLGSLPTLTGIFGLVVANTAIYKLLDRSATGG
ncbi:MAG: tRNA threonylcarbamoyladenosine dehydratase [Desulfobulbaceae bacterium]|nr:MAG: tRNA threonylcarbamoyladenosine dehydratase [Desulfobulbaceae bacterium]